MDELLALNNNIEIISDLDIDGRVLIKKHSGNKCNRDR